MLFFIMRYKVGIGQTLLGRTGDALDSRIDSLQRLARANGISGFAFALIDMDSSRPMDLVYESPRNRSYRVGSLGKVIVAMGLLKLAEQRRISLNEEVRRHLPGLGMSNPWESTSPVRVVHLLEHTAGLDEMHFNEYFAGKETGIPLAGALLRNSASKRVRWPPGTRNAYTNVGYAIAARMIETATGEQADAWLRENILMKMGMTASLFDRGFPFATQQMDSLMGMEDYHPYLYYPSVGFVSNVQDLSRLMKFLLGEGHLASDTLLQAPSVRRIWRSETTLGSGRGWYDGDYGLGFKCWWDGVRTMAVATGLVDGFQASMILYPGHRKGRVFLASGAENLDSFVRKATGILDGVIDFPEFSVRPAVRGDLPEVGTYRFGSPRNELFTFETALLGDLDIRLVEQAGGSYVEAKLLGQAPFRLDFGSDESSSGTASIHRFGFAGRSSKGPPFILVEGKYFEKREATGHGILNWSWWIYQRLVYLYTILTVMVLWWDLRQRDWASAKRWLVLSSVLPFWWAWLGYQMLTSERYWELGQPTLFSLTLSLVSVLIPLTSLSSIVFLFSGMRVRGRRWVTWLSFPLALGNLGMSSYLIIKGMIPFFSWRY
jgi:CubicO group peptidase (beta-lactamase class C family)